MADFQVMGGVPDFYSQILNSARQNLVRMPDGSLAPAPRFGGSTSLDAIYGGILPPSVPSAPLVSRSVNTVPIDPTTGNPIGRVGNNIPKYSDTIDEQRSGWRPAVTEGVQPALTATMPQGARPSNIPLPSPPSPPVQSAAWDPFNTINPNADQTRMPPGTGLAYNQDAQNEALAAIGVAAPASGDSGIPIPRVRPDLVMPFTPSPLLRSALSPTGETLPGASNFDGSPVQILAPRGGNYVVKRGDTLWDLARQNNTTVNAIALANGLRDPSKIRAGQQLTIPTVPAPRMRPPAMGGSKTPSGMTVDEVGAFRYHG